LRGSELAERVRTDARLEGPHHVEESGLLNVDGSELLWAYTGPAHQEPNSIAIVVCEGWFEANILQRANMQFLRRAADAGYAGIYVQPPGAGDSEGSPEDLDLATRVRVASIAAEWLAARHPQVSKTCFTGGRVGGTVALLAAVGAADTAVAWDPVLDPNDYWRQLGRLSSVMRMRTGNPLVIDPFEQLKRTGEVALFGVPATRSQLDEFSDVGSRLRKTMLEAAPVKTSPSLILTGRVKAAEARASIASLPGLTIKVIHEISRMNLELGIGPGYVKETLQWLKRHD
jgi:pimeloyl-ACP methyl ester carboxylesterase